MLWPRLHLSNLEHKQLMCPNQVPYLLFGECHMEYKFQSRRADGLAYWFSRVEHSMLIVEDRPRYCSNPAGSLPWEVGPCNLLQSTKKCLSHFGRYDITISLVFFIVSVSLGRKGEDFVRWETCICNDIGLLKLCDIDYEMDREKFVSIDWLFVKYLLFLLYKLEGKKCYFSPYTFG